MALPKVEHPTFDETIPSTKKDVTLRPFTVQEEKIILTAASTKKTDDVIGAIKQIINNCVVSGEIDTNKLALFDIEWLFVKIRSQSVNNTVEVTKTFDDVEYRGTVNLDDVSMHYNENHTNKIMISDNVGVIMSYPSLDLAKGDIEDKDAFNVIEQCIDSVFDDNDVYVRNDNFTNEELNEWVSTLSSDSTKKIMEFFNTMPTVQCEVELVSKDGKTKTVTLKGLADFF